MIKIENLNYSYDNQTIIKNINYNFQEGKITGIIGTNGVGKTTLLKLISGILKPKVGKITNKNKIISYVPDVSNLYQFLTGKEYLNFCISIQNENKENVDKVLKKFGMTDTANNLIKSYSHGMKQKIALAAAIIGKKPDYIILDEPFTGIDLISSSYIKNYLKEANSEGTSIILTTHQLELAYSFCDYLIILHDKKIALELETKNLTLTLLEEKIRRIYE